MFIIPSACFGDDTVSALLPTWELELPTLTSTSALELLPHLVNPFRLLPNLAKWYVPFSLVVHISDAAVLSVFEFLDLYSDAGVGAVAVEEGPALVLHYGAHYLGRSL